MENTAVFLHPRGLNLEEGYDFSIFFPEVIISQNTFFYQFCMFELNKDESIHGNKDKSAREIGDFIDSIISIVIMP